MQNVRLRSANRGNANNTWNVNNSGNVNNNNAYNSNRCAPDCIDQNEAETTDLSVGRIAEVGYKEPSSQLPGIAEANKCEMGIQGEDARSGCSPCPSPMSIEEAISFEAIYESAMRCRKGVGWKGSVAHFFYHAIEETMKLEQQLKDGSYQERPIREFTIYHPKQRNVVSIAFRDRVYQRSLNDNIVYPVMTEGFIGNNMACQKGKGTDAARQELLRMMREAVAERHWDPEGIYVLQCDIRHYYQTMRHDLTEAMFRDKLACVPGTADRVVRVLRKQYTQENGYNPGSQLVQIAGISVLDPLDHYITERLGCRHYIRYMDDFILLCNGELEAKEWKESISGYLHDNLSLELHPRKTRIYRIQSGITFLGFDYHVSATGQVYMLLSPSKTKETRRKLYKMVELAKQGIIRKSDVDNTYTQYRNYAKKGKCCRLLQRMDRYYFSLWEENYGC